MPLAVLFLCHLWWEIFGFCILLFCHNERIWLSQFVYFFPKKTVQTEKTKLSRREKPSFCDFSRKQSIHKLKFEKGAAQEMIFDISMFYKAYQDEKY